MTTPKPPIRLTLATCRVLDLLLEADSEDPHWGYRICDQAELGPGTVYPILERLEEVGWITGEWEQMTPANRPRRRVYTISDTGCREYSKALARKKNRGIFPARLRTAGDT
ncbi:PadR family transcriptional regulator [Nonomuraea sp. NPDC048826]|uniref:PadR family transcriptional regulator n=1 Tax=Nonomuraea sp. NPDC048826 TaxID=3364347 RepID=UPI0037242DD5